MTVFSLVLRKILPRNIWRLTLGATVTLLIMTAPTMPEAGWSQTQRPILLAKSDKIKKKEAKKTHISEKDNYLSPERREKILSYDFKVPPSLKAAVDFWKMVYTKYDRNFEIFHDTENLGIVYSVMDFTDLYNNDILTRKERLALMLPRLRAEETRIQNLLLSIHQKQFHPERMTKEEKRIFGLFKNDPDPDKFLKAADEKRIRSQTGIRNKFVEAIRISGAYLEELEDIFMNYGLPIELTRLIFVESMFNVWAQSKAGASGLWQMMPTTGRLFGLNINKFTDERNDPILATHAAARLLQANFDALGTWPLAINAYNSGRATMTRAVQSLGTTDIGKIIHNYRSGVYGFASRNFYPSFLAALEVANHFPKYLGEIPRESKLRYDIYITRHGIKFEDLALAAGVSPENISELNPQISGAVRNNSLQVPPGFAIRIPKGTSSNFAEAELMVIQNKIR